MRICLLDHHGKSLHLFRELHDTGEFEFATDAFRLDYELMLVDTDSPYSVPYPVKFQAVQNAAKNGIPVVLYQHGAIPQIEYDGIRPFSVPVSCLLVHGEGHAEIYNRIGLPVRVEVIGWSYSPLAEPESESPKSLLFGPIHPWANGKDILSDHRFANERAYKAFRSWPGIKTVRMYGEDAPNGIDERQGGIRYLPSDLGPGLDLIAGHDACLGYGTIAYQALARGKRVVMIGQHFPPMDDRGLKVAAHWSDYSDYLHCPACLDCMTLEGALALGPTALAEWRRLFVGERLDVQKTAAVLKSLRPNRATRRRLKL